MSDNLNHYLQAWSLSDPQLLAETATSHVYTVTLGDARVVLKLLTPSGKKEQNGAVALRCFDGHGAVRLLRDDGQAHLLEYAEGEDLIALVKRGEDEQATAIIADVLNQLHAAYKGLPPQGLNPLRTYFRELFQRAEDDKSTGLHSIYMRAASTAETLLADPRDVCILHGDIHHENIRHHAQRGWLAFDTKGLVGESTFDVANTLCNPMNMPDLVEDETRLLTNAEILARGVNVELPRVLAFTFAYVCLSASWWLSDGVDPHHELRIAKIVEQHIRTS